MKLSGILYHPSYIMASQNAKGKVTSYRAASTQLPKASTKKGNGSANSVSRLSDNMSRLRISTKPGSAQKPSIRKFSSTGRTCKTVDDIKAYIQSGSVQNIIVMAGAGISVPSGIPDFRTPGSGLYDNLKQYRIPYPEAIFDIDYFETNPKPFFTLARELYPSGKYRPSLAHYFVRLLHEKSLLHRMYTQNIDGLERIAGIPAEKLVEAHGTFASATCQICDHKFKGEAIKDQIYSDRLPRCKHKGCLGIVKPDITFFGEDLPRRFYYYLKDFPQADLLLVMGTSLEVMPFAGILDSCRYHVPRMLINKHIVGPFKSRKRSSDVVLQGDISASIQQLVMKLGWQSEFETLVTEAEGKPFTLSTRGNKTPGGSDSSPSGNTGTDGDYSVGDSTNKSAKAIITPQSSDTPSNSKAKQTHENVLTSSMSSESSIDSVSTISLGPSLRVAPNLSTAAKQRLKSIVNSNSNNSKNGSSAIQRQTSPSKLANHTNTPRLLPQRSTGKSVSIQPVSTEALFPTPGRPRFRPTPALRQARVKEKPVVAFRFKHTQPLCGRSSFTSGQISDRQRVEKYIKRFETKRGSAMWNYVQFSSSDESSSESDSSDTD